MHSLVRTVFSRLHQLNPGEEEAKLQRANDEAQQYGELRMTVSTNDLASASTEAGPRLETRSNENARTDSPPQPEDAVVNPASSRSQCERWGTLE
jgi:brefeldin A-resistance guanine nucleotide exchange factor 1